MTNLSLHQDAHSFTLECRTKQTTVHGVHFGEWESPFPDRRYTHDEVVAFEDDLTLDDCWGVQWRARWDKTILRLRPNGYEGPAFVHTRRSVLPDEVLPPTGWHGMMYQLGLVPSLFSAEVQA